MTCSEILNLIALIVIPIIAVVLGYKLQDRAEKRKDKMQVFKAVMTFRYGWSKESVEALNSIPIVFSGIRILVPVTVNKLLTNVPLTWQAMSLQYKRMQGTGKPDRPPGEGDL